MLVGVDEVLEAQRPLARGSVQEAYVHSGIDGIYVGVGAEVALLCRDSDLLSRPTFGRALSCQLSCNPASSLPRSHVSKSAGCGAKLYC